MKKHTISKLLILFLLQFLMFGVEVLAQQSKKISVNVLHDKISAAWIGQMIGNMYGLPHENKYISAPGLENWPYGYSKSLDKLKKYEGAFSDDDTDIEYMYLLQMLKHGPEPSYAQLREAWIYHIRDRVWLANRGALGLMHFGFTPPFTGNRFLNPHWFQIDPQLINEIWAVTAPGMVSYAASKSDWAARITSDEWGVEPTIFYGAMYSAAFFEKDIRKLIETGIQSLPVNGRFRATASEMKALYAKYPADWKAAWSEMAQKYYVNEPAMTKTIWNANLNGACAILAMLYGNGDFQRTLDLSCAMGFDADNQAATVAGLLGIVNGMKGLPANLYLPIEGWTEPFNNNYVNITRYDLPNAKITEIINQTLKVTIDLILEKGGKKTGDTGNEILTINTKATYNPPLEFYLGLLPEMEIDKPISFNFYTDGNKAYNWKLVSGTLPKGMEFLNGQINGTPLEQGYFKITLQLDNGSDKITRDFNLLVRGENIALKADTIYANIRELNEQVLDSCWYTFGRPLYAKNVSIINDGKTTGDGSVFYSLAAKAKLSKVDYYGFGWKNSQKISRLAFHSGCLEEFGGWFTSLNVQFLDDKGKWISIGNIKISPSLPETNVVFFQPHFAEYIIEFATIETKGIRIIGDAMIQDHWNKYTKQVSGFTSITELCVYN